MHGAALSCDRAPAVAAAQAALVSFIGREVDDLQVTITAPLQDLFLMRFARARQVKAGVKCRRSA
jgi:hypothetical protein